MLTKRIISNEIYDPCGAETYFEEMERKGLHLQYAGWRLLTFEKGEPREMRYRIEYWKDELPEDLVTLYADCGWEYVTMVKCSAHVFRAPASTDIPELHTDGEIEAQHYRCIRRTMIGTALMNILLLAFAFGALWRMIGILFMPRYRWMLVEMMMLVLLTGYSVFQSFRAWQYWKNLRWGRTKRRSSIMYRVGGWMECAAWLIVIGAQVINLAGIVHYKPENQVWVPTTQMAAQVDAYDLPYFTLQDIEPDGATDAQSTGDIYTHEPLSRVLYLWESDAPDGARLELSYYDARIPATAPALAKSIRVDESKPVQTDAFDVLYRYQRTETLFLTARQGRVVVDMTYWGEHPDKAEALFYETFGRRPRGESEHVDSKTDFNRNMGTAWSGNLPDRDGSRWLASYQGDRLVSVF